MRVNIKGILGEKKNHCLKKAVLLNEKKIFIQYIY